MTPLLRVVPLVLCLVALSLLVNGTVERPACTHSVFCNSTILRVLHAHRMFQSMKDFVDRPLMHDPATVVAAFDALFDESDTTTNLKLQGWLDANFHAVGSDLVPWRPSDWRSEPRVLSRISDSRMKEWFASMNAMWRSLGRQTHADIDSHPERHTLLACAHPFIVSAPDQREFHYWDYYWIINGLMLSDMATSARYMIENLLDMVSTYSHPLFGGRLYYEERSQPPMLPEIIRHYYRASSDTQLLARALPLLEQEYQWWMVERVVRLKGDGSLVRIDEEVDYRTYYLNQYRAHSNVARPERFIEDVTLVKRTFGVTSDDALQPSKIYRDIASASESGWDMSSRWCGDAWDATTIRTTDLLPVDLNSILYKNEMTLSELYAQLATDDETIDAGTKARYMEKSSAFLSAANNRIAAIMHFFWDEGNALWLDFDLANKNRVPSTRGRVYLSSLYPFWAGVHRRVEEVKRLDRAYTRAEIESRSFATFTALEWFSNTDGIATSLADHTGQSWDYPSAMPGLQMIAIDALFSFELDVARKEAEKLVSKWLTSNYIRWKETEQMYAAYSIESATQPTKHEPINLGFAWTIGVDMELLVRFCSGTKCIAIDADDSDDSQLWLIGIAIGVAGGVLTLCLLIGIVAFVLIRRSRSSSDEEKAKKEEEDDVELLGVE